MQFKALTAGLDFGRRSGSARFNPITGDVLFDSSRSGTQGVAALDFIFTPSDLHDNNAARSVALTDGPLTYYSANNFARAVFTTSATSVDIAFHSEDAMKAFFIAVISNGATVGSYTTSPAYGSKTVTVALAAGAKTVQIISGNSGITGLAPSDLPMGNFLVRATFNALATLLTPRITSPNIVVYADSIGCGGGADTPVLEGWVPVLRSIYAGSVLIQGYGGLELHDECSTGAARQSVVDNLATFSPESVWIAAGTNDYAGAHWTAANFGIAYADFLVKLHAALPGAVLYAQSPLTRSLFYNPNTNSETVGDFSKAIADAVYGKSYAYYVNGLAVMPASGLSPDLLHPSTSGHALIAAFAAASIASPPIAVSADSDVRKFIAYSGIATLSLQNALDSLVSALKAANLWTPMVAIYPFIGGSALTHSFNLKDPNAYRIIWGGAATHGATGTLLSSGNGSYSNLSSDLCAESSIAFGMYVRSNADEAAVNLITADGKFFLFTRFGGNAIAAIPSSAGNVSGAADGTPGLFTASRTAAGSAIYRNGASIATAATAPDGVSAAPFSIGSSAKEMAFAFLSTGLSSAQNAALYTIIQAYQTALSRNV